MYLLDVTKGLARYTNVVSLKSENNVNLQVKGWIRLWHMKPRFHVFDEINC